MSTIGSIWQGGYELVLNVIPWFMVGIMKRRAKIQDRPGEWFGVREKLRLLSPDDKAKPPSSNMSVNNTSLDVA